MDETRLKRKIAVIMAADVVGYSRLVAHDEDGTLRRLMDYRQIFEDFVGRGGGRIFNTAGDAVLAEFDSAVEAIRASMDIQEALKTRNAELPDERRMIFRIGISLGDVVQRDGDLLGDGVNIAARLQALAAPGGICVSRSVQEQVVNKVAIVFQDIGEQSVKNIPRPVYAYVTGDTEVPTQGAAAKPDTAAKAGSAGSISAARPKASRRVASVALATAAAIAIVVGAVAAWYFGLREHAPEEPAKFTTASMSRLTPAPPVDPAKPDPPAKSLAGQPLKPMEVPFVPYGAQLAIERLYMPQTGPKALAIANGAFGISSDAPDVEAAKAQALSRCESRIAVSGNHCTVFAIGDSIVWDQPPPRVALNGPLAPRFVRVAAADADNVPFLIDDARRKIFEDYQKLTGPKALAVGATGLLQYTFGGASSDDIVRRVLQLCGERTHRACLLVAIGDDAVTRMPQSMRIQGLLDIDGQDPISGAAREELIAAAGSAPWYALARGAGGAFGVGTSRASESEAIEGALSICREGGAAGCTITAIGPYRVRPKS